MLIDQIAIASINSYQRYLSPHKGFSCPYRLVYGGESCSQFLKVRIASVGFSQAIAEWQDRLSACAAALPVLQANRRKKQRPERDENYVAKACGESNHPACDRCYWACEAVSCLSFFFSFLQ